jgi:hypothetical protein
MVQYVPEVGGVVRNATQRISHGDRRHGLRLQPFDDAVPAGGFGKGTVDEHHGRLLFVHESCPGPVVRVIAHGAAFLGWLSPAETARPGVL